MHMKTKILFLLIAIAMSVNVFSQEKGNVLIAYFSATGTTASAAEKLASATGGTLFRITPAQQAVSQLRRDGRPQGTACPEGESGQPGGV